MDIFLATLFIIICVLLIIVVLLQKGRGGGLGAAFGGSGGSAAFGTKTGDVFTWVTIVLTGLFLVLAVVTNLKFRPEKVAPDAPAFNPVAKAISEPTSVTLQYAKGTKVYYTVNGDEPNEKSTQYTGAAITVKPGDVIKARTLREGLWSDLAVAQYPPVTEDSPTPTPTPTPTTATGPATQTQ